MDGVRKYYFPASDAHGRRPGLMQHGISPSHGGECRRAGAYEAGSGGLGGISGGGGAAGPAVWGTALRMADGRKRGLVSATGGSGASVETGEGQAAGEVQGADEGAFGLCGGAFRGADHRGGCRRALLLQQLPFYEVFQAVHGDALCGVFKRIPAVSGGGNAAGHRGAGDGGGGTVRV